MDNNLKVLIIGGTGTLSRTVMKMLVDKGHSVTIVNRGNNSDNIPNEVCCKKADFYNVSELRSVIEGNLYDVIIDFLSRRKEDIERVFPLCAPLCHQYVFISSCCVFRRAEGDFPLKEDSPKPNTDWRYNVEKYEAEQTLIKLSKGLPETKYTIVRPYITYDNNRIPLPVAPTYKYHKTILERIKSGKPIFVIDDGSMITTVTYVTDFAKIIIGLLGNSAAYNNDFNAVSNNTCTHEELARLLFKKLNIRPNIIRVPREKLIKYMPNYASMVIGDRTLPAIFNNEKLIKTIPSLQLSTTIEDGIQFVLDNYQNIEGLFDYSYDGQTDYMLSKIGVKNLRYKQYGTTSGRITYCLYRYLPYRLARKINKYIK